MSEDSPVELELILLSYHATTAMVKEELTSAALVGSVAKVGVRV